MKFSENFKNWQNEYVAPHVGAWIEIRLDNRLARRIENVAPHVGAWIEILNLKLQLYVGQRRPSRRGVD